MEIDEILELLDEDERKEMKKLEKNTTMSEKEIRKAVDFLENFNIVDQCKDSEKIRLGDFGSKVKALPPEGPEENE